MTQAGRIYFGDQRVLYLGPSLRVSVHGHHALQLFLPLEGGIRLRAGPGSRWREYEGAIVASGQSHEADSPAQLLATFWLEPTSEVGRRLAALHAGSGIAAIERAKLARIVPRLRACQSENHDAQRTLALVDDVAAILAPTATTEPAALDPRVDTARHLLRKLVRRRAALSEIAAALSLSPSRLTHLFSAGLGLSPRRYLLWLRLLHAVDALAHGRSIADAALEAGFSDAPHLTRTFRDMLGFTPAAAHAVIFVPALPRRSRFVQDTGHEPT